jgi:hypothetical protein
MATPDNNAPTPQPPGFPFVTVGATLATLFVFLFLMWVAARKESPLETPKLDAGEVKAPPATFDEVKARNEAALNGVGAKMPREEARAKLLATLKTPNDKLPFPTPEPPTPAPPKKEEKKDDTKDGKEKP